MTANLNTGVQASKASGTGLSMASLRSGLSVDGLEAKLFADILSQTTVAPDRGAGKKAADVVAGSQNAPSAKKADTDASRDTGEDARAALRALMQRIREDAKALYQNRQRIRHLEKRPETQAENAQRPANAAPSKETAQDETMVAGTQSAASIIESATNETEAPKTGTDDAACSVPDSAAIDVDAMTDDDVVALAQQLLADIDKTPSRKTSVDERNLLDEGEALALVEDLVSAEQAALALLAKMMRGRAEKAQQGPHKGEAMDVDALGIAAEEAQDADVSADTTRGLIKERSPEESATARKERQQASFLAASGMDGDATSTKSGVLDDSRARDNLAPFLATIKNKPAAKGREDVQATGAKEEFLTLFNANNAFSANASLKGAVDPSAVRAGVTAEAASLGEAGARGNPLSQAQGPHHSLTGEGAKPAGSYDFASQLSAVRAQRGGSTGLPSAVEQIALQLHKSVKEGQNEMTVHLRPAELGRIAIRLTFGENKTVQGTVVADNQATLDLLLKDVGSLQRALQEAGLRADSGNLQFSLRGDGQPNFFNSDGNGDSGRHAKLGHAFAGAEDAEAFSDNDGETYYLTPGRVNMRV